MEPKIIQSPHGLDGSKLARNDIPHIITNLIYIQYTTLPVLAKDVSYISLLNLIYATRNTL